MPLVDCEYTAGVVGRSTLANDTPGARKVVSYTDSSGNITNEPQVQHRIYNGLGGAATAGAVYMVVYDGDEESNPKFILPAAVTADAEICVATAAHADATWCWVITGGYADVLVEGTTDVAKDDFLKVTAPNAQLVKDGTTKTTDSFAIACADQTANSAVSTKVYLLGGVHDID